MNVLAGSLPIVLAAQLAQATLFGTIRDSETGQPLEGAVVTLTQTDRSAATDSSGQYVMTRVPPGPQDLSIRRLGYTPRSLNAIVPQDGNLEINVSLTLEPIRLEPLAVGTRMSIRGVESGTGTPFPDREMSAAAVSNHPMLAEPDAFQAMAGGEVLARQETPGGLYIRGGASDQTAYTLDGIQVFNPYHAAGVSSAWNPDALSGLNLSSVDASPGAPHALSGTLDGTTLRPGERFVSRGSVSTTQARITIDGPLGDAGSGYVLSARSGLQNVVGPNDPSYLSGPTGDWLGKIEAPALGGQLRVVSYGNVNDINAAAAQADPGRPPLRHGLEWYGGSVGADWVKPSGNLRWRLAGWAASGDAAVDWNAPSGTSEMVSARRDGGFFAGVDRLSSTGRTTVGVRVEGSRTRYRTEDHPDSATTTSWGLDAATPIVTLLGGRTGRLGRDADFDVSMDLAWSGSEVRPGPRAVLRWRPIASWTLSGSYAQTYQFAQSLRNPESVVGHIFPVDIYVGSDASGMPVARSGQGVVAAEFRPAAGVRVGIQAYDRSSSGLALVAPMNGGPYATAGFAIGRASARGAALDVAVSAARYGAIASYGWQRVRYEYGDSSYVPEQAPEHVLEGGLILLPTSTTTVRVSASAELGRRTTVIPNAFEWESCNLLDGGCEFVGSPDYGSGPVGSAQLPPYARLDVGIRQQWRLGIGGRRASMALFGTFTNILNRKNLLTYARDPSTGEQVGIEMRPSAPLVVGVDWSY